MCRRKGISDLIEASSGVADEHPSAHLYLVAMVLPEGVRDAGGQRLGGDSNSLRERFVTNPYRYLRSADLFVLASHRDPNPLVISEARAAGCPIIASDADGIPQALDGGPAAVLFAVGNVGVLAASIGSLLDDPDLRRSWREAAAQGLDRYRVERVVKEVMDVY
jgi:glycosyltransferase involved in cell wall biosynthesis